MRIILLRLFAFVGFIVLFNSCTTVGKPPEDKLGTGEHRALINGTALSYHVHGRGPACIVHGGPPFRWDYLRMPEVERFLTVVYLEPVGTGNSARLEDPREYSSNRYVEDIEGLRKYLGLEKTYLLGHSMGGYVSIAYALKYPAGLKGLILYGVTPVANKEWFDDFGANLAGFSKEPWFPEAIDAFKHVATLETDEEVHQIIQKAIGFYVMDYTKKKKRVDEFAKNVFISAKPWRQFLVESASMDLRQDLQKIPAPTLVVQGKHDAVVGMKYAEVLKNSIAGSNMVVLENSGHLGHFEEPKAFADATSGFVGDVEKVHAGQ